MKFAVLGAGSAGQGIAGYFALNGHEVRLYNRTPEKIAPIAKSGKLKISGVIEGAAEIRKVSSEIKDIVTNVDSVLVTARAFGHQFLLEGCLDYLENNTIVLIFTGYWAALRLRSLLSKYQRTDITIAETTLLPLICQLMKPGHVNISGIKSKVRIAVYPPSRAHGVYEKFGSILPQLFLGDNVLETSLENYNPIIHVPIALFNLGQLEKHQDRFGFYHDGISPKIAEAIDAIDAERMNLIGQLNLDLTTVRDMLVEYYGTEGTSTYEIIRNCRPMKGYVLPDPFSYVREDLLYGLVPMASMCDLLGIPAKATKSLISSWQTVDSVNYWQEGVKVDRLGVEGMNSEQIVKLATSGQQ